MCLTEEKREEHEQFVQSVVKKQQRNKRKREPNMCVAAVLECTVRRICSEVCSSYFCLCMHPKRRKLSSSVEQHESETKITGSLEIEQDVVSVQTKHFKPCGKPSREIHETFVIPETPQRVPGEESEASDFLHSLTMELSELPSLEEVDELLREIECGSDLDAVEEEIGALLNTNTGDPFHPGLLEVLFNYT